MVRTAAQKLHGARPIDGAALGHQRHQVFVFFAIVIVNMQAADALLHDFELMLHAGGEIGVAGIEDKVQIQMREAKELLQTLGV